MQRGTLAFDGGNTVTNLFHNGDAKVIQLSFPKGKALTCHRAKQHVVLMVLTGNIQLDLDENTFDMHPLDYLVMEPGQEHEVAALEESTILLIMIPEEQQESLVLEEDESFAL